MEIEQTAGVVRAQSIGRCANKAPHFTSITMSGNSGVYRGTTSGPLKRHPYRCPKLQGWDQKRGPASFLNKATVEVMGWRGVEGKSGRESEKRWDGEIGKR